MPWRIQDLQNKGEINCFGNALKLGDRPFCNKIVFQHNFQGGGSRGVHSWRVDCALNNRVGWNVFLISFLAASSRLATLAGEHVSSAGGAFFLMSWRSSLICLLLVITCRRSITGFVFSNFSWRSCGPAWCPVNPVVFVHFVRPVDLGAVASGFCLKAFCKNGKWVDFPKMKLCRFEDKLFNEYC